MQTVFKHGVAGAMRLQEERAWDRPEPSRSLSLRASSDGRCVMLVEVDRRARGGYREHHYEIPAGDLIAYIKSQGISVRTPAHDTLPVALACADVPSAMPPPTPLPN